MYLCMYVHMYVYTYCSIVEQHIVVSVLWPSAWSRPSEYALADHKVTRALKANADRRPSPITRPCILAVFYTSKCKGFEATKTKGKQNQLARCPAFL